MPNTPIAQPTLVELYHQLKVASERLTRANKVMIDIVKRHENSFKWSSGMDHVPTYVIKDIDDATIEVDVILNQLFNRRFEKLKQ